MYSHLIIYINDQVKFLVHYNTNAIAVEEIIQMIISAWEEDGIPDFDTFRADFRERYDSDIIDAEATIDYHLETVTEYKEKSTGEKFVSFGDCSSLYCSNDPSGEHDIPNPSLHDMLKFEKIKTELSD